VPDVHVEPWTDDLDLLHGLLGDPAMMAHLGGPEPPEKIASRNADYARTGSRQYRLVAGDDGAGWVGYWEREWRGHTVYEIGWSVLPAFQGRGLASAATAAVLELARAEEDLHDVHAFPSVENGPSNGLCRKLGFELLGEVELEYPKGSHMRCNDWRLALTG
jgi:RimJ/RimL family protein N-acetyltransferase